jgi:hypothetical protein
LLKTAAHFAEVPDAVASAVFRDPANLNYSLDVGIEFCPDLLAALLRDRTSDNYIDQFKIFSNVIRELDCAPKDTRVSRFRRWPQPPFRVEIWPGKIIPELVYQRLLREAEAKHDRSAAAFRHVLKYAAYSFTWQTVREDERSLEEFGAEIDAWQRQFDSISCTVSGR